MPILDNNAVAILSKVNELAKQYGLKPYEFVAVLDCHSQDGHAMLKFELPSLESPHTTARFDKMMIDFGLGGRGYELSASYEQITKAIDHALDIARKPHAFR